MGLDAGACVGESEKAFEAISAAMAIVFCNSFGADSCWSAALSAQQSHGTQLSDTTCATLAGRRSLALDSYARLSDE